MKYNVIILILLFAFSDYAHAQTDADQTLTPSKLFIRYGLSGAFIDTKNSKGSFGGGSDLSLGWYFNPRLAIYATSKGYHMDKSSFTDSDPTTYFRWGINGIGARYHVSNQTLNSLYIDGAFLQSSIRPDIPEKLIFSGNGFSAGIGLHRFVASQWAISADLFYVYSKFRKRVEEDETVSFHLHGHGANISISFAWHPFANREIK